MSLMNQEKDFAPLVGLVRERISLVTNKRLRDALAERGDPARVLERELPAAVAIGWEEKYPDREPPASEEEISEAEIRSLRTKVARGLEKQGDEDEDKLIRAARRAPAYSDEDEDEGRDDAMWQTLSRVLKEADLTPREQQFVLLFLDEDVEDEGIAKEMGIEKRSVDKTKARLMKKLRESAAELGVRMP
jgi:DNA-directed RNA polymerase sigma subunit (sigma70/sigma32)